MIIHIERERCRPSRNPPQDPRTSNCPLNGERFRTEWLFIMKCFYRMCFFEDPRISKGKPSDPPSQ